MKKFVRNILFVLVIGLLLFGLDWFPFKIVSNLNKEMSATLWNKDGTEYDPLTIRIEGKLINRLWRNKEVNGTIEVEGYEFSKKDSSYELLCVLHFSPQERMYSGSLKYVNLSTVSSQYIGMLYVNETFNELFIVLPSKDDELKMYVAPAINFSEANSLVRKYMANIYKVKP